MHALINTIKEIAEFINIDGITHISDLQNKEEKSVC